MWNYAEEPKSANHTSINRTCLMHTDQWGQMHIFRSDITARKNSSLKWPRMCGVGSIHSFSHSLVIAWTRTSLRMLQSSSVTSRNHTGPADGRHWVQQRVKTDWKQVLKFRQEIKLGQKWNFTFGPKLEPKWKHFRPKRTWLKPSKMLIFNAEHENKNELWLAFSIQSCCSQHKTQTHREKDRI